MKAAQNSGASSSEDQSSQSLSVDEIPAAGASSSDPIQSGKAEVTATRKRSRIDDSEHESTLSIQASGSNAEVSDDSQHPAKRQKIEITKASLKAKAQPRTASRSNVSKAKGAELPVAMTSAKVSLRTAGPCQRVLPRSPARLLRAMQQSQTTHPRLKSCKRPKDEGASEEESAAADHLWRQHVKEPRPQS